MVNKIIAAENSQGGDWGPWRNNMLFVADDDFQLANYDGMGHYIASENTVAVVAPCRPALNIEKIYEFSYPTDANYQKPECAAAIQSAINAGVGYVNFFGHGSPAVWTDEHILSGSTVAQLTNVNEYPFIAAFSCATGEFDIPGVTSLSQSLLTQPQGGALATFSATYSVYEDPNATLAEALYQNLFAPDSDVSFGMAIIAAKAQASGCYSNSQLYDLFGDPSLRILPPASNITVSVQDTTGKPLDTLKAFQKVVVAGTVAGPTGQQYGGAASAPVQIGIFNPPKWTARSDGRPGLGRARRALVAAGQPGFFLQSIDAERPIQGYAHAAAESYL